MFPYRRFDCICEYENKNLTKATVLTQVNMSLVFTPSPIYHHLIFLTHTIPQPYTLSIHVQLGGWAIEFNIHTPPPLLRTYLFFLLLKKSPNCIHPCRLPIVMGLPLKNFLKWCFFSLKNYTNSLFPLADYPNRIPNYFYTTSALNL